jgi:hypothetical protein
MECEDLVCEDPVCECCGETVLETCTTCGFCHDCALDADATDTDSLCGGVECERWRTEV